MSLLNLITRVWNFRQFRDSASANYDDMQTDPLGATEQSIVVTNITAQDLTTNISGISVEYYRNSTERAEIAFLVPSAAGERLQWNGTIVLTQKSYIKVSFFGTVAGDDLQFCASGYKIHRVHPEF